MLLGLSAASADADTIYVCWDGSGDYRTIQEGIDAAVDGDEVVVCDGTYTGPGNKNLDFHGKAITVRSANGPDNCIIDCEESGRGFHFHSGETDASVLNGLTIKNGTVTGYGGGIRCYYSSPTISNCIVADCRADYLTINYGGGILCVHSDPTITECTIKGNLAEGYGGGVSCVEGSSPRIMNCIITRNTATSGGGGGGISCDASTPKILNCTITENAQRLSVDIAGGVLVTNHSHVTMSNCILWGNEDLRGPPIKEIGVTSWSFLEVSYCDVAGGEAEVYVEHGSTLHWGPGNIDIDPELTRRGNHMLASSPCIDAGDPEFVPQPDEEDIDGEDRIVNDRVDMGADEFLDTDADTLPDWWEQRYFGSPTGGDAAADDDGDGLSNSGEYAAARNPFQPSVTYYVNVLGYDGWDGLAPEWDGEHGPKATIQAAIDATDPYEADVVIVAEGTYTGDGNRRLDYLGKVITVRSTDPDDKDVVAATVIDCEGSWYNPQIGFRFLSRERLDSVLAGLTIINTHDGEFSRGGAVLCWNFSAPLITHCVIADNYDTVDAGGIRCMDGSRATITDCMIVGNTSEGKGGGIRCATQSDATIKNCMIVGNSSYQGGGIYYTDSDLTIADCLIMDNEADDGGGVYGLSGNTAIANCTIFQNTAEDGGGICCVNSSLTLTNCILWSNTAVHGPQIWGSPSVTYSCVQGGWPGEGNIGADPLFAFADDCHIMADSPCIDAGTNDPPGGLPPDDFDGNPRPLDGDGDSDAVADMGAYEFNPDAPSIALSPAEFEFLAFEGEPNPGDQVLSIRNCGGGTLHWEVAEACDWLTLTPSSGDSTGEVDDVSVQVDIGGLTRGQYVCSLSVSDDEAMNSPRTVQVTLLLAGTLHVPDEYATIQAAIDAAVAPGDVVLVADGTYTGDGNRDLDFGGKLITARSANGPESCVMDCEGSGRGFRFHSAESADAVVDGFTITNGQASNGGAVSCEGSSPTVTNCVFSGNTAADNGGGMYNNKSSRPAVTHSTFSGNSADSFGGGMCNDYSNPTVANCTFSGNSAAISGGGMLNYDNSPTVTNCTFSGNTSTDNGGGLANWLYSNPTVANCTFSGNSAGGFGGGMVNWYDCHPTVTNCTFSGNSAGSGGGMHSLSSSVTLSNCILWGDSPDEIDGPAVVTYSDVQGGFTGEGNIDADPLFVDPDKGDYRLSPGSPCIDAADNEAVPADELDLDGDGDTEEPIPFDLDGNPRFIDDLDTEDTGNPDPDYPELPIVDMGAYEFQIPGDLNGDGCVDQGDLGILLADWGCTGGDCPGDCDHDGDTDQSDLGILLAHWGQGCP